MRDPWTRLKALNNLRSTGALTRAEFDTLKADLAGSEPDGPPEAAVERLVRLRHLADQRASGALSMTQFEARKRSAMLGQRIDPPER